MNMCSHHLLEYLLKDNLGVPALITEASCQPGYHSHPGMTCHPMNQKHNNSVRQAMGGDRGYYAYHSLEYLEDIGKVEFFKQMPPGMHSHAGREQPHPKESRHRRNVIAALGGEKAYYSSHPHAKPKKKTSTRGKAGKTAPKTTRRRKSSEEKRVEAGWKESKAEAKRQGLEAQPIQSKLDKIDAVRAKSTPILRGLKGKSEAERKEALHALLPKSMREGREGKSAEEFRKEANLTYNPDILTGNNIDDIIQSSWVMRWETEYQGRRNDNILYSQHHYDMANKQKWSRMRTLGQKFPRARRFALNDMRRGNPTDPSAQLGASLLLMMQSGFRPGGEAYAKENGTFGITSLRRGHISIMKGDRVKLSFTGKHQQEFNHTVSVGKDLHKYLRDSLDMDNNPNSKLFPDVNDSAMRQYVKEFHPDLKPKDFRTISVNKEVFKALSKIQGLSEPWERDLAAKKVIQSVSEKHGHKADAAIKSYIHPMILRAFIDGKKIPKWQGITKMLMKQDVGNHMDVLDEDETNFFTYMAGIHVL